MKTQSIIDIISYLLCCKQYQIIVVFGKTKRGAADFVLSFSEKFPDYVGLKRTHLGIFESVNFNKIYCHRSDNIIKGLALAMVVILSDVNDADKEEIQKCLIPTLQSSSYLMIED